MNYRLTDLIDVDKTRQLLENFLRAGGISAAIIDIEGVVLVSSRWKRLCTDFHRVNEKTRRKCVESDTLLANELLEGKSFSLYRCQNGLTDAASPIIIEGRHVANAFVGQFFTAKPDMEFFRRQAREYGFDEAAYMEAVSEISVVPESTLTSVLLFLTSFAEMIASLGLKQLEQLQIEKELREAQQRLEIQNERLRQSEEDLNRAQAVAHTGSWRMDVQRNVLDWSDETYRIFGIPRGVPMTYETFLAIVHPEDRELVDSSWRAALYGNSYDVEHRIIVGDALKWVRERAELEFDEQGALSGGFGTVQDITERKRIEDFARVRLGLLEFATSHSAEELLQKALDEIAGQTNSPIGFLHSVSGDQKTILLQAWSTRTLDEFCGVEGKGMHLPVEGAGVWADCIHQKRPVMHNDYCALPHRKGMPVGHPALIRELLVPIMRSDLVAAILGIGNKPGDYTAEDVEIASYLVDVAWEIAARKQMEEALKKSHDELEMRVRERTAKLTEALTRLEIMNQELQEFTKVASHDLQEPLRKIQAFGDRLRSKCKDKLDDSEMEYITRMEGAANRMQQLILDLLDLSRVSTRPEPLSTVDLNDTAGEMAQLFQYRQQVGAVVEFENLPTVCADPVQMRQLFQNLLGNALKFQRGGGQKPHVKVYSTLQPNNTCLIFFEDNGIGFEEKYLDRIFAPFQRLHGHGTYEGTGMGLAICRKIVERHGWTITAKSSPGAGATFILTLPVCGPESGSNPPPAIKPVKVKTGNMPNCCLPLKAVAGKRTEIGKIQQL